VYSYGVKPGEYKLYVYRITLTSEDGKVVELSPQAVRSRCQEICVPYVEELYYGQAEHLFPDIPAGEDWHTNFLSALRVTYLNKKLANSTPPGAPDEGIVIRKETSGKIEAYKLKSEEFLAAESASLDRSLSQDLESAVEN
jgi:hypothetical protein